jgi:hypothetical protein
MYEEPPMLLECARVMGRALRLEIYSVPLKQSESCKLEETVNVQNMVLHAYVVYRCVCRLGRCREFSLEKVVAKHAPTDKLKLQVARTRDNCLPLFVARWD